MELSASECTNTEIHTHTHTHTHTHIKGKTGKKNTILNAGSKVGRLLTGF